MYLYIYIYILRLYLIHLHVFLWLCFDLRCYTAKYIQVQHCQWRSCFFSCAFCSACWSSQTRCRLAGVIVTVSTEKKTWDGQRIGILRGTCRYFQNGSFCCMPSTVEMRNDEECLVVLQAFWMGCVMNPVHVFSAMTLVSPKDSQVLYALVDTPPGFPDPWHGSGICAWQRQGINQVFSKYIIRIGGLKSRLPTTVQTEPSKSCVYSLYSTTFLTWITLFCSSLNYDSRKGW